MLKVAELSRLFSSYRLENQVATRCLARLHLDMRYSTTSKSYLLEKDYDQYINTLESRAICLLTIYGNTLKGGQGR